MLESIRELIDTQFERIYLDRDRLCSVDMSVAFANLTKSVGKSSERMRNFGITMQEASDAFRRLGCITRGFESRVRRDHGALTIPESDSDVDG